MPIVIQSSYARNMFPVTLIILSLYTTLYYPYAIPDDMANFRRCSKFDYEFKQYLIASNEIEVRFNFKTNQCKMYLFHSSLVWP